MNAETKAAAAIIDLMSIDPVGQANGGVEVELFHPNTNEPTGVFITVLGKDSDEYRKLDTAQQRRRMQKMTKGNTFRIGAISKKEMDDDLIDMLAAVTKSWRNVMWNGKVLDCTPTNARELYTERPWIREQLDAAVADRALFTKS